jgi:ABC-2 type transport system ATP-binding protein
MHHKILEKENDFDYSLHKKVKMDTVIVRKLKKEFHIPVYLKRSFYQRIKHYLFPNLEAMTAVDEIDFTIQKGQRVAFIGPNGAGKSTTIKMLTGIMYPTSGTIEVLGKSPTKHRKALSYEISAVFGHSSKLWYYLPVQESYDLLAAIYDIPRAAYQNRLNELVNKFHVAHLLTKPVRQLSLGERMRCEIVASFLHKPKVVFLDEPTIGLDLMAKAIIRDLLRQLSHEESTTLLLTSHDIDDIEIVCDRVIMIDRGKLILDDQLAHLKTRYIKKKVIQIIAEEESIVWDQEGVDILEYSPHRLKMEVDLDKCSSEKVISALLKSYTIKDVTIEDPSLETIVKIFYAKQVPS